MNQLNDKYNFEQFLREGIEDFKMMPERKIWYGIYNQLHPAKRWPSMAISLVILTSIMFVGISNNNNINNQVANSTPKYTSSNFSAPSIINATPIAKNLLAANSVSLQNSLNTNQNNASVTAITFTNKNNVNTNNSYTSQSSNIAKIATKSTKDIEDIAATSYNSNGSINASKKQLENKNTPTSSTIIANNLYENVNEELAASTTQKNEVIIAKNNATDDINVSKVTVETLLNNKEGADALTSIIEKNEQITTAERSNKPNATTDDNDKIITKDDILAKKEYTLASTTVQGKLKQKGSLQYYLTPAYGYRTLIQNTKNTPNQALKDQAALNIELGAVLQYKINKNVQLTIGAQANYANYVSMVVDLGHTTPATLAVNNFAQSSQRTSTYATKAGNDKLNKTTWQIAVPIGANLKLLGNDKFSWHIGANVQPTYILGGTGFVLSADNQNYIAEKALLRKVNINTAAETFVSIKTANAVTLILGPQVRYQLLSTYKSTYNHNEKMYNFGFKIGVVTKL